MRGGYRTSYASTTRRPGREKGCGSPRGSCTEVASARVTCGRKTGDGTGVRPLPYRAMIAYLRCATSTSIGDDRTCALYLCRRGVRERKNHNKPKPTKTRRTTTPTGACK